MRVGAIPEGILEWLVLRTPLFPQPALDVMPTMLLSRTVMAGVRFGVFDRLAGGVKTAAALASETGCDAHAMELLLDALVSCGYLERENGQYRNSAVSERWLRSDAPQSLANYVRYNYDQWEWMNHLEDYIQHGTARDIHEKLDATGWRNYLLGMRDLSRLFASEVVSKVRLGATPRSLLDIGGGHGYYAIAFCRRYPALRATVLDLEPAAGVGRELVEQAGLSERIQFRVGHLAETPFGENHDAVLLFNVIHHLDEETTRAALAKVLGALRSGGQLVLWEPFREEGGKYSNEQLVGLLALFFGLTSRGQTYAFSQIASWARHAGFREIDRVRLRAAPNAPVLVARK